MLEQNFQSVYEKFKLQFFRRLFSQVREREGSLSAMEAFSVEVIHELDAPTIGQFADFLGISQSNATYKVNSLIRKGYIVKENSDTDRREYHLKLSDKFYCYNGLMQSYIDTVMARIHERFTPEELATRSRSGSAANTSTRSTAAICHAHAQRPKRSRAIMTFRPWSRRA